MCIRDRSDTTPTADPNQFSVEFYDYKTNELISKSNKNNLNEKLKAYDDLIYMTSDNKVDSIDAEPSYVPVSYTHLDVYKRQNNFHIIMQYYRNCFRVVDICAFLLYY